MFQHFLRKQSTRILRQSPSLCSGCYRQQRITSFPKQLPKAAAAARGFHTTRPTQVPIVPIPAIILGALKTGKLVSLVSLSSKTSLTLLPHTFRRGSKGDLIAKVLAGIPLFGFTLLLVVGLDQAPNTSRLRLIYLSEEEETEIVEAEIDTLLEAQSGLVAPKDSEVVMWLQTIVDNLAGPAVDDIRDPVRCYADDDRRQQRSRQIQVVPSNLPTSGDVDVMVSTEEEEEEFRPAIPKRDFEVNVIWDSTTVNAMCAGSRLIVYNLLIHYMDYDTTRMAVILSHEIAHSLQRHFVEQHGFASLMFMLGDITRGVFWMITESMGPYVNQKINEYISTFITLETQTTYNRKLEKEADLVGLKILAKAGYDPRAAVDVWQRMADLESELGEDLKSSTKDPVVQNRAVAAAKRSIPATSTAPKDEGKYEDLEYGVREFLDSLVNSWFGSSHPPNVERIEYMQEHLEEAIQIYEQALKMNGPPKEFIFSEDLQNKMELTNVSSHGVIRYVASWLSSLYSWSSNRNNDATALAMEQQ
ncbi:peptidase family M48-domain-containing protein [Mucor lusitanicus]|uniref:Peptidase family M48-domain-containing protein n=2 Tax=Mucor circinelloides f. lusitanicus TaxID=29924 RepID=A0A8H4F4P9_MUCCL|nr:peptidase family M48-domain-containing protein [Mucor lusitanicus]